MREKVLLDSDTLSMYMRHEPQVVSKAQTYLRTNGVFSFSIITRFEILRGLKVRDAYARLATFEVLCANNEIIGLTNDIIARAADVYAALRKAGTLIGDADILIAATAMEFDIPLVSNNTTHFARIAGLKLINWNT